MRLPTSFDTATNGCVHFGRPPHTPAELKVRVFESLSPVMVIAWESAASINDPRGDIRDAKLAVTPEGQLMMLTATQFFDTSKQRHQSHAWFTEDLKSWDGAHDVGDADIWAWGIQFHKGIGYSIGYRTVEPRFVRLYATKDGKEFDNHVEKLAVANRYPNESVIVFDDHDTAYCLLRCQGPSQLGVAKPPYKEWTWAETGCRHRWTRDDPIARWAAARRRTPVRWRRDELHFSGSIQKPQQSPKR